MMSEARFTTLCEAYGAETARWPAAERADAVAFLAAHTELAEAALAGERGLDSWLGAYVVDAPAALRQRVIEIAPRARAVARAWRWATAVGLGFGLAASAAAGVAAGFTLAPASVTRMISPQPATNADALADPAGDVANG